MDPRTTTKAIWKKFHVHRRDNLPFEGWHKSTRETLYELWGELGFKIGAEIGVRMGTNALEILNRVLDLKLYCIDPWEAYLRVTDVKQEKFYRACARRLRGKNVELIKKTSMDAVTDFEDEFFDFIYVDGRHDYDFVAEDLIHWYPKVKKGGILSGHDYYNFYDAGIITAVDAFCMGNNIKQFFITREKEHSWFLVRE